jgi:SH3-like domain-containing protein
MSIEAMKQALEALEFIPESGSMLGAHPEAKRIQSITALRQAIEQAQKQNASVEPVAQWQKRHIEQTDGMWCDTNEADANWWLKQKTLHGWEFRKVYTSPPSRQKD